MVSPAIWIVFSFPEGAGAERGDPFLLTSLEATFMDPLTMGLITGGSNLLGSMFSSSTAASNVQAQIQAQQQMQAQSEQFNAGQAQIGRDYNTQMSNTAYQRASSDMKSAGLNPMMMFGSGSAASTPSSPTASVGTPTVPVSQSKGSLAGVGDAVRSGLDAAVTAKTMDKLTDEIAKLQAERGLVTAETDVKKAEVPFIGQRTETEKQQTLKVANEAGKLGLEMPAARFSARSAEDLLSMPEWLRASAVKGGFIGGKASDVVAPIVSSATAARRLALPW
jgi:hypothetical protein